MSVEKLASELDVSASTVRNWETGRTIPALSPLATEKYCNLLGVDIRKLAIAYANTRVDEFTKTNLE